MPIPQSPLDFVNPRLHISLYIALLSLRVVEERHTDSDLALGQRVLLSPGVDGISRLDRQVCHPVFQQHERY